MTKGGLVRRTAAFNITTSLAAAATGILLARWLGPTGRGHYAALTAYFGLMLITTELGIGSSIVYHVSKFRSETDTFVRTAAAMYLPLGLIATCVTVGVALFALDSDNPLRTPALILVACLAATLLGATQTFALQALSIPSWNIVRLSQPLAMIALVTVSELVHSIDVTTVIVLMALAIAIQTVAAQFLYMRQRVTAGAVSTKTVVPMLKFGLANLASTAPNSINARFDQLVLALMVAPAVLGRYNGGGLSQFACGSTGSRLR